MANIRRISKKYCVKQILVCFLVCQMLFGLPAQIVRAATPVVGSYDPGTAGISQTTNTTTVNLLAEQAIINWDNFNTSDLELVEFLRNNGLSSFAVLNKVSGDATVFNGDLEAIKGTVFILNPKGITFGPTAYITARNLVASSMKMRNSDFLDATEGGNISGDMKFTNPSTYEGARVVANYGTINADSSTYLVGKNVLNAGTITTNAGGLVAMVAGDEMLLGKPGSDVIVKKLVVNHIENHTVDNGGLTSLYDSGLADSVDPPIEKRVQTGDLVLAAGDIWSNAIENVQDLTATAHGDIHFEEAINITGDMRAEAGLPTEYEEYLDFGSWSDGYYTVEHGGDIHAKDTITAGGNIDIIADDVQLDGDAEATTGDLKIAGRQSGGPDGGWGDVETAGLTAGGDIEISVTGGADTQEWVWDGYGLFGWRVGHWEPISGPIPGDITLNDDAIAGGNLTLFNNTWTAPDVTLQAGVDIILENGEAFYQNCDTLTGDTKLTLDAKTGQIDQGTATISVTGSELIMRQAPTLNLAGRNFDLQDTTHLTLESYNGSVFATDTADGGDDENAADQWASIGAKANGGVILSGHDDNINARRLEAAHGPIEVDAKTHDIVLKDHLLPDDGDDGILASGGGNITLTGKSVKVIGDIDAHHGLGIRPVGYNSDLTIDATDDIELDGYANIDGDMDLSANDEVIAKGNLIAGGSIDIYSSNYTTTLGGDLIEATDNITLHNNTKLNGSGAQRIDAVTGMLTAKRDVEKTSDGTLTLAGGNKIYLGDDVYTKNGDLIFEDDVIANGTGSLRNQLFDADKGSDSYENDLVALGDITKTTSGRLTLDGGAGSESKIHVAGDVTTLDGDLTFEDDVVANGEGDQTFTAGKFSGYQILSKLKVYGSVTKEDSGDLGIDRDGGSLILESGWQMDIDNDITVVDGDLTAEADQHIYVGRNILAKGDILIRADKDLDADAHQGDPLYGGDVDVDGDITSTQGNIDIYSTDFTTYLGGDVHAAYDVTLHNNTILDGGDNQALEAGLVGDGTLTAEGWLWKTTPGHLYLFGYNSNPDHRGGKAIDLRYDGCLLAASTSLGNIELYAPDGDIQISGDLTTFGPDYYESDGMCIGDFEGSYDRPTGGVSVIAENGKIYTDADSPDPAAGDYMLNIGIVGNSDDVSHRIVPDNGNGNNHIEVRMPQLGVDLPWLEEGEEGKAAIVVLSREDLKFGPDTMLIAKGTYDSDVVDDRSGVGFLADPLTAIGGVIRDEGDPIDVAIYVGSMGTEDGQGNVHLDGRAIDVAEAGTMVVDAYDTVTFGDFETFNLEDFDGCEDIGCFLVKLAMRFHEDIDFGDLCDSFGGYVDLYGWYDGILEDFLNYYFDEGFFFNIGRLEVASRISEWLFQAVGRLPFANDPTGIAALEAFIGGDYILRGAGLGNPLITDGRAWVLVDPISPPPLFQEAGEAAEDQDIAEGGCPPLMNWLANEIGVPAEDIQVVVANTLALNTDIQPCEMCARLLDAATTLEDAEGTQIAAMARVVNEFVTTPAPPSPEQMTQIAAALAEHVGDGTHYAATGQWIDALVAYVGIMNTEMGYSASDAAAFAEKYLTPVTDLGNATLTAYVQARLAALGG